VLPDREVGHESSGGCQQGKAGLRTACRDSAKSRAGATPPFFVRAICRQPIIAGQGRVCTACYPLVALFRLSSADSTSGRTGMALRVVEDIGSAVCRLVKATNKNKKGG